MVGLCQGYGWGGGWGRGQVLGGSTVRAWEISLWRLGQPSRRTKGVCV